MISGNSGYLRLRDVCELLGRPADRSGIQALRRDIRRKEEILGVAITTRLSKAPNAPLVTTLPTLRHYFPEWFDTRSEVIELVRQHVEEIAETLKELKSRDNALAARIRANTADLRDLAQRVKALQSDITSQIS